MPDWSEIEDCPACGDGTSGESWHGQESIWMFLDERRESRSFNKLLVSVNVEKKPFVDSIQTNINEPANASAVMTEQRVMRAQPCRASPNGNL